MSLLLLFHQPATATSYTASLSVSSGLVGSPVTITYAANGATTAVVTPTVSGVSGTFSPTTIALSGASHVTVTFTPSTAGTATLASSAPGLTAPGSETYTASSPAETATVTLSSVTFSLLGSNTVWSGTPFSLTAGGGTLSSQTVTDHTHATVTLATGGANGPWTLSDGAITFLLSGGTSFFRIGCQGGFN